MSTVPFPVNRFGGLSLRADPEEVGAERALDVLNVTFAQDGRVAVRDGYTLLYSGASPVNMARISTEQVFAVFGSNSVKDITLYNGTAVASNALSSPASSVAAAGTSGALYFTDGTVAQIKKYLSSTFSSPAGLAALKGNFLAVQPLDDRLVVADSINTSRVIFSDPGTPETFTYDTAPTPDTGNYIDLTPGDGEAITGMAVFGTQLYVFKKTKFFVFYGNSTDTDGSPIFNYRMVDTGVGIPQGSGDYRVLTAVHRTGLYFVGPDGVYRTTGGDPVRISDAIGPAFKGSNLPIPATWTLAPTPASTWLTLGIAADRLYLTPLSIEGTYVLDLFTGEWSVFDWAIPSVLDGIKVAGGLDTAGYTGGAVIGAPAGTGIALSNRAQTTDNGTAITWRYASGQYTLSDPGRATVTLESRAWGTGTVTLKVANDNAAFDTGSALTLGTSPATADAWQQIDREGTLWQHRLSGSGPATVNRLIHYVSFTKPPGVQ